MLELYLTENSNKAIISQKEGQGGAGGEKRSGAVHTCSPHLLLRRSHSPCTRASGVRYEANKGGLVFLGTGASKQLSQ